MPPHHLDRVKRRELSPPFAESRGTQIPISHVLLQRKHLAIELLNFALGTRFSDGRSPQHESDPVLVHSSSVSYPSTSASFGAAATAQGSPTIGTTQTSTSTISAAVAPAFTAASAWAP
jgi:hypothetical protein